MMGELGQGTQRRGEARLGMIRTLLTERNIL